MSEVRHAKHYHYTSWPDHGVPQTTDTILRFRDLVREDLDKMKDNGPVLVHCSTYMCTDMHIIYIFLDQYVFLHQCLLDGIQSASTNAGLIQEHPAVYENILAMQDYEVSRV
ncbi:hypothetical protein Chor_009349 [Crotalus horridus]